MLTGDASQTQHRAGGGTGGGSIGEQASGGCGGERIEERSKREIVTTELVAGADFFHHLPCGAGRRRLEDWERVRVKPRPHHPTIKHIASDC